MRVLLNVPNSLRCRDRKESAYKPRATAKSQGGSVIRGWILSRIHRTANRAAPATKFPKESVRIACTCQKLGGKMGFSCCLRANKFSPFSYQNLLFFPSTPCRSIDDQQKGVYFVIYVLGALGWDLHGKSVTEHHFLSLRGERW